MNKKNGSKNAGMSCYGVLGKLKDKVDDFVQDNNLQDVQKTVEGFVKSAQKDFKDVVGKDLKLVRNKFDKERKQVEKKVEKIIVQKMKQTATFLETQKGELDKLQKKIESLIPEQPKKKSTAKARKTHA